MASIRRTSMIDSNKTQLNSDYDYSMLRKWALGNKGGLLKKSDFIFDKSKGEISSGSEIAEAVILCKRPTSYPIQNQTFLAQFQFTWKLENLQTVEGTKIYIEIKENLIVDPTLIADQPGSTNFAKGFDIGEVKATPERPSHENYLKLYEISSGEVVDHRKEITLPALDSVAERTTTLESKVVTQEEKIEKLESKQANAFKWMYFCFDKIESGKQLWYIRELKPENCNMIDSVWFNNVNDTKRRFFCWVSNLTIWNITLKLWYNWTLQYDLVLRLLDEDTWAKIHPNAEFVFSRWKMNNANGQLLVSENKAPFTIDRKYLNKRIIVELDMNWILHATNYWRVYCSDVLNYQWYKARYNSIAAIEDNDTFDKMRGRGFVFTQWNNSFVDKWWVNCYYVEWNSGDYQTNKLEYPVNLNGDFDIEIYATCALWWYNDWNPISWTQWWWMGIMNSDNSSWLVYCDPRVKQITTSAWGSINYASWTHDYEPRIRRFKRVGTKIKVWHKWIYLWEANCKNWTTGKFVQTRDRRWYSVKWSMYFGYIRHYAGFWTFGYSLPYISANFILKSGVALAKWDMGKIIWPLLYPAETTTHSKLCEFVLYWAVPHSFPLGMVYDFNDWVLSNSYSTILNRSVLVGKDNFFEGKNHLHLGQTAISATTGSIPPGNFKGYLNASLPNGEEIKIPYYWK